MGYVQSVVSKDKGTIMILFIHYSYFCFSISCDLSKIIAIIFQLYSHQYIKFPLLLCLQRQVVTSGSGFGSRQCLHVPRSRRVLIRFETLVHHLFKPSVGPLVIEEILKVGAKRFKWCTQKFL